MRSDASLSELKQRLSDYSLPIWVGLDPEMVATEPAADLVVGGLPGKHGPQTDLRCCGGGKDVALATKEVLVMAGALFMQRAQEKGVAILPWIPKHRRCFSVCKAMRTLKSVA